MAAVPDLAAAEAFLLRTARLIDRHRFAVLFRDGDSDAVVAALMPYLNRDGGFGHGLEPDLRGPDSEPVPTWTALLVLDEIDRFDHPMVRRALDYVASITTTDGGVPFVLPAAEVYPRAPWWEAADPPIASLNPTAAIAALLHKRGIDHPWLAKATEFSWRAIESSTSTTPYEARAIMPFLEWAPDRARANAALQHIGRLLLGGEHVAIDPDAEGEIHLPLDFSPRPDSIARVLFDDDLIDSHLDALGRRQQADGGWPINWLAWTPMAGLEWRAWQTIASLTVLRAYGRLPSATPRSSHIFGGA